MASEGFLYTHAYANAPVCAPARNTILTGVYANSNGSQHMRSHYRRSSKVQMYPVLMRKAGYYCTNNAKEDYNFNKQDTQNIWDESSRKATYKNRKPGQPFLAVFNFGVSHESSIHKPIPSEELRHKPEDVTLPPYHPDTKEFRHDWAQYYDKIEDLDKQVGKMLDELDKSGLADSTIVFYYGDHGGVLGRSKRFVYETGTRVPFIVRIPELYKKYFPGSKPGSKIDRIISFVDLAPTLLSLAGAPIPETMQGHAFLGDQKTAQPEYAYMFRGRMDERYDMSRAVRDKEFRYIHNYMPYRIYGQHINFLWKAPSMVSWEKAYKEGKCDDVQSAFWNTKPSEELYDTENDPWEVNNLANDPAYRKQLLKMRNACDSISLSIRDAGFIPEAMLVKLAGDTPFYDYMHSDRIDMKELINAANLATIGAKADIPKYLQMMDDEFAPVRYWGATGLIINGKKEPEVINKLKTALDDPFPDVALAAAEALYNIGEKETAVKALVKYLNADDVMVRTKALNVTDALNVNSAAIRKAVTGIVKRYKTSKRSKQYDLRLSLYLLEKWGIKP
jgi:arylsulfatase A-like enzyme